MIDLLLIIILFVLCFKLICDVSVAIINRLLVRYLAKLDKEKRGK